VPLAGRKERALERVAAQKTAQGRIVIPRPQAVEAARLIPLLPAIAVRVSGRPFLLQQFAKGRVGVAGGDVDQVGRALYVKVQIAECGFPSRKRLVPSVLHRYA